MFAASNSYLGSFIGEFLGELFLNLFFVVSAAVLTRSGAAPRGLLLASLAAGLLGGVAMLRNVLPMVQAVAALNNAVLPAWMLVLGGVLVRHRAAASTRGPLAPTPCA
ncbi:hypothetical protein ABXN37_13380 [Piscinibacter sakaiensis]|uniref:hypothetical protein n=1 Tax=Piscinibacter sakaiensis TaxID=1547922 RepID=UPI00372B8C14